MDVAIVGAGYTGLWTAYYLKKAAPSLRIAVIEREFAGFGASGRNGGWLSGGFSWSREKYLKTSTRQRVVDMQRAMAGTVDEVVRVAEEEGIDADILQGRQSARRHQRCSARALARRSSKPFGTGISILPG